jgi:hypothetical protein
MEEKKYWVETTTEDLGGTQSLGLKNLSKKMLQIMSEVGYVQKGGTNTFQNYKYAKEADVAAKVRESMVKHGVFLYTSVTKTGVSEYLNNKGATQFMVSVLVTGTFVDSDSGESYTVTYPGDGADTGDKGIYKAITGADKYLLMKTFLIETGDDPEKDEPAVKQGVGVHKATDGAKERLDKVQSLKVENLVGTVIDCFSAGQEAEAFAAIEGAGLDSDERVYLWSQLDSGQRSALKKIGAAIKARDAKMNTLNA